MKELEDVRERVGAGRAEEPAVVPARLPGPGISNAALARAILQRQPPGTAPPPVLPGQTLADRAPELIGAEITAVMRGATRGGEWPEFADEMIGAVRNAVGNEATGDQMQEIGRRAHAIADTKHVAAMGVEYSIPAALSMLEQLYHKAAGVDGLTLSFGLEFLTKLLGRDSTTYLSGAFAPNLHTEPPPSAIEDWITIALDAMSDGDTLMKLELEGTVDRLIDLRGQFAAATDTKARQALGSSIGETSRRALLLDRMLQDARKQVGTSNRPLFESVAASLGKITSAAQQASGPETTAMDALGGDLELLGEQRIDLEAVTGQTVGTSIVNPEEAFPKATDAADQQFMSDLQSRVAGESSRVKDLHDKLIPQTYTLPDFVRAYKGWHGFFSQQQEMNDPIVGLAYELTDSVYGKLLGTDTGDTYVSIQQGIGRAIMMPMIVEMVRSGGVTGATSGTDFAKQLTAAGLHRTGGGRATGSASSPSYQYGEMYGRDTGTNEVSSARSLASSRESSTSAAANVVSRVTPDLQPQAAQQTGLAPDASVPIAGARPTTPEEGWTYLIDVRDQKTFSPNPPLIMREQNTVPKDVVDYMLARQQQLATLQHMHRPMTASGHAIGGPGVRNPQPRMSESGLETGTGMAAEMYVEGAREGGLDPTAASLQQTLKTAREQSGAKPGGSGDVAQQVIDAFQTEVTRYLNEYFEKNQTVALRVGAILAIAEAEHNIHLAFDVFTNADKFRDMIEKTVEISAGLAVLSSFGVWGELASAAIGAYLRSKGVANVTAVISIGAFLKQAADADSFGAARGWGLVAGQVAIDLSSVMQNIVNDPIAKAVHGAVKKGLSTPGDVADTIRPTMKDPAAREAVLGAIDQRLTELASKQGDPAAESEAHQLRSFRDSLLGQSKMIDAGDLHTPLKEPSAQERAASIFEKPHQRSARDVAAMHAALGDLAAKVPLIENPNLPGSTVQVRYGDGGGVRIEYGPEAEPRHIEYHRETARELMGYEGVLGHIRRVADKVLTALRLTPGYGTKGFEASHEVKKLRAIERDLQAREQAIGKSLETISEHPETAQRELAKIRRELEAVQKQLDEWEKAVDDYSQGRGIVAAVAPESAAPVGWPVDPVNPRKNSRGQWIGMPDTVPDRRVLEFPGGERIWRNPATREIVIESTLGPAPGRQSHERQFPARGEYAQDYQSAMYELAHAQGQGTGFESPYALLLAPSEVNQRLQRWGIEEYLYRLRDATPQGTDFHLVTSSSARPRSRELASIEYRIDVSNAQGQRKPLFAFTISVEGDRSNPHVFIDPESVWMSSDRDLETLRDMVDMSDIHERFEQADLAARLRGRP